MLINEQKMDLVELCDYFKSKLKGFDLTNDTPHGRMFYQVHWLKQELDHGLFEYPFHEDLFSTARYIYTNSLISDIASDPADEACVFYEISSPLKHLIYIATKDTLKFKKEYYPHAITLTKIILNSLERPDTRILKDYESLFKTELRNILELLNSNCRIPFISHFQNFKGFRQVNGFLENSLNDIGNTGNLTKDLGNILFEGIRPRSWMDTVCGKEMLEAENALINC